jgi:hypothetical protein
MARGMPTPTLLLLVSKWALKIFVMTGQKVNQLGLAEPLRWKGFPHVGASPYPRVRLENPKGKRQKGFGDFTFCYIVLSFPANLLTWAKLIKHFWEKQKSLYCLSFPC